MGDADLPEEIVRRLCDLLDRIQEPDESIWDIDLEGAKRKGIINNEEAEFLRENLPKFLLDDSIPYQPRASPEEYLSVLLSKVMRYQMSLPEGRAVPLDELERERIFTEADLEFMRDKGVTYKPHKARDFHRGDMFHMPTEDGGCVFIGPGGPKPKSRRIVFRKFETIVEEILALKRKHLMLHIEFTHETDGMGVTPDFVCFSFRSAPWRGRLASIREVAEKVGLTRLQNAEVQNNWLLSFRPVDGSVVSVGVVMELLKAGCGFGDADEVVYSCGELDEREEAE